MKLLKILLFLSLAGATVTDYDGNVYETVLIGEQLWMSENLKVTHYRNGDAIPTGLDNDAWTNATEGAFSIYNDDPANGGIYGNLYNWYTVDDERAVCPEGWHIPTDDEFTVLTDYLGGEAVAGGKMKTVGTEYWNSPNTGATNESGFTALPSGFRDNDIGHFYYLSNGVYFWSSTEGNSYGAWVRSLDYNYSGVEPNYYIKRYGFSVRCLADEVTTGCTDPDASNYNPDANADDGSCYLVYQFQTKEELQAAVDLWIDDNATALATYGEINTWDTSLITDMSNLFFDESWNGFYSDFNGDISNWDVSNVTDMSWMFYYAPAFNGDISNWDVSSVTDMNYMFRYAYVFNQDLSTWDVSSVTSMYMMFSGTTNFNQDLSSWDVSSVTSMYRMFYYTDAFNQDLSTWDVSSVTDMTAMFDNANALSDENKCAIHTAWSYLEAWIMWYDWLGLCIMGCTDELADNYNPEAGSDDGSCLYCPEGQYFAGEQCVSLQFYGDAGGFEIDTKDPEVTLLSPNGPDILAIGSTLEFTWTASDDRFDETPITLSYPGNQLITANSGNAEVVLPDIPTYGFNVSITAIDYYGNTSTDISDSTFVLDYFGCMDELADNYSADAAYEDGSCEYTETISLAILNNLISFPGRPKIDTTEQLMESLAEQGVDINFIIGQGVGLFNTDGEWSGNLNVVDEYSGYWINVSDNIDWALELESYSDTCLVYDILFGNNLVSYAGVDGMGIIEALGGQINSALFNFIIGQGVGLFYTDGNWSGNLNNLYNNKGYWLNSNATMSFAWGNCEAPVAVAREDVPVSEFAFTQSTEQAFYLIEDINIDGQSPQQGDMVLAYHNDMLVGSVEWIGKYTPVPVMGRDISPQTEGFCEVNDIPSLKLFKADTGDILDLNGDLEGWSSLGVYTVESLQGSTIEIPTEYVLHPAYPNPFNPVTSISFGLPQDSNVKLEVYNIKGMNINTLTDNYMSAGNHVIEWDATEFPSGVYFVKLTANQYTKSQKLMLIK